MDSQIYRSQNGLDDIHRFIGDYLFASELLAFVEHISGENRWFIDECVELNSEEYLTVFKSYRLPEYSKYRLQIKVKRSVSSESGWEFSVIEQITG